MPNTARLKKKAFAPKSEPASPRPVIGYQTADSVPKKCSRQLPRLLAGSLTHRFWLADGRQTHISNTISLAIPLHPSQRRIRSLDPPCYDDWYRARTYLRAPRPDRVIRARPVTKGSRLPVRAPAHASPTAGSRDRRPPTLQTRRQQVHTKHVHATVHNTESHTSLAVLA